MLIFTHSCVLSVVVVVSTIIVIIILCFFITADALLRLSGLH